MKASMLAVIAIALLLPGCTRTQPLPDPPAGMAALRMASDGIIFFIDKNEVTTAQYNICMKKGGCSKPVKRSLLPFAGDRQPIVGVSYNQAWEYCRFAGKRLPTADEWLTAYHGPDGNDRHRIDPGSANTLESAPMKDHRFTSDVGSISSDQTDAGVTDLAGNTAEWIDEESTSGNIINARALGGHFLAPVDGITEPKVLPADQGQLWLGIRCAKSAIEENP